MAGPGELGAASELEEWCGRLTEIVKRAAARARATTPLGLERAQDAAELWAAKRRQLERVLERAADAGLALEDGDAWTRAVRDASEALDELAAALRSRRDELDAQLREQAWTTLRVRALAGSEGARAKGRRMLALHEALGHDARVLALTGAEGGAGRRVLLDVLYHPRGAARGAVVLPAVVWGAHRDGGDLPRDTAVLAESDGEAVVETALVLRRDGGAYAELSDAVTAARALCR